MKILVIGGCGYVGSALIPKLIGRGYGVKVVDLCWFGNHLPSDVEVAKIDAFSMTQKDLEGFDQVIFLAGLSNDPMADYSPAKNFVYNAACPAYLAYLAKKAGVKRMIYAGSCSVYGYTVNELYNELSPAVPSYPYGISKLQGEMAVLQLRDPKFSVICFRKGTICGHSPRMRFDLVVNTMFKSAMVNKEINVSNPSIWRPILSIQDAVSAYIRAVEANEDLSGVFNIASDNYTVGELADVVHDTLEKESGWDSKIVVKNISDVRNYKVSCEKAQNVLAFKPSNKARDIMLDLISHRDLYGDFKNKSFYNIETFKSLDTI